MTELICECGEQASGPDAESVTAAMQRHLSSSGHSLRSEAPTTSEEPQDEPEES